VSDPVSAALGAGGIREASGLVDRWLNSAKNRNDQISGRIVYPPTLALAYMRTYCNQALRVHLPLQGFSLQWPPERRAELRNAWTRWRGLYAVLPAMETVNETLSFRQLELPTHWWESREDQRTVVELQSDLARMLTTFLRQVAYRIRDDKRLIRPMDFDTDDQKIKAASDQVVDLIEDQGQELVAQARTTVVQLRETVLRNRPGLPQEIWQPLDTLAFAVAVLKPGSRLRKLWVPGP
jgi:hypothetical protein